MVAGFTRDDIADMVAERQNRSTFDLFIEFTDGTACHYVVIQKQDAEAFVADFESLG